MKRIHPVVTGEYFSSQIDSKTRQSLSKAVAALEELQAAGGSVDMAYAMVAGPINGSCLIKSRKIVSAKVARHCLAPLIGKRHGSYQLSCQYCFNGDHSAVVNTEDGKKLIISQPYGLGLENMEEISRLCREHGLNATVQAESPYYPGRSLLVVFKKKDSV